MFCVPKHNNYLQNTFCVYLFSLLVYAIPFAYIALITNLCYSPDPSVIVISFGNMKTVGFLPRPSR